jgi:uncharacterized protein (DUF1330 family)
MLGPTQHGTTAMAAYLIANITVRDPARFEQYRAAVPAVIAQFGGRYLVRGGAVEAKEGAPGLNRLVILEFPDMAALRGFYDSAEYAPLLALRLAATEGTVALVEGVAA